LLADEKELTRRRDELVRRRQDLPWVPIGGRVVLPMGIGRRAATSTTTSQAAATEEEQQSGFVTYNFRTNDVRPVLEAG
jgi:predicted dithiol-disulfide oxidoreductase (DUF899 family)